MAKLLEALSTLLLIKQDGSVLNAKQRNMDNSCPICHHTGNTKNTIASWIVSDVARGKRKPCLSCHTSHPEAYAYALTLIDDKNYLVSEMTFWGSGYKYSTLSMLSDRLDVINR